MKAARITLQFLDKHLNGTANQQQNKKSFWCHWKFYGNTIGNLKWKYRDMGIQLFYKASWIIAKLKTAFLKITNNVDAADFVEYINLFPGDYSKHHTADS
jgi:hypothetical protein